MPSLMLPQGFACPRRKVGVLIGTTLIVLLSVALAEPASAHAAPVTKDSSQSPRRRPRPAVETVVALW